MFEYIMRGIANILWNAENNNNVSREQIIDSLRNLVTDYEKWSGKNF